MKFHTFLVVLIIHRQDFLMLDTIKLGIPLTQKQHTQIKAIADANDCWQWILHNPSTGELLFRRTKGLANVDGKSFHRQLKWDIPTDYGPDCKLFIEFSVPKYWYGQNIRLLYDFLKALQHLRGTLNRQFNLKGKNRLPEVETWHVSRVDVCYAWKFPNQRLAQRYLDSLKHLHFPRKRPTIYPTAILFAGSTYSLKFYLKLPEFKSHDRKELLKSNASLEWINYCESIADGVLRFEATLRGKYLKRQNIDTVGDLLNPVELFEWVDGTIPNTKEEQALALFVMSSHYLEQCKNDDKESHPLHDGLVLTAPATKVDFNGHILNYEGGTAIFRERDRPTSVLQYLITKFIGENSGMQRVDEIQAKLSESYKPVKAARLMSFWLYVQRFGSERAREDFGHNSYYVSKRDLKKAGISLIEPPSGNNITILDRDFMQNFKLEVPSENVTNKVDDFRDSENVLNFVPKMSGYDERA